MNYHSLAFKGLGLRVKGLGFRVWEIDDTQLPQAGFRDFSLKVGDFWGLGP